MAWSRGWSSTEREQEAKTDWVPVANPQPVFDGPEEKRRYEDALASCQRAPGEDIVRWIERVIAAAQQPREPGMEG